jgi:hypothetical protein
LQPQIEKLQSQASTLIATSRLSLTGSAIRSRESAVTPEAWPKHKARLKALDECRQSVAVNQFLTGDAITNQRLTPRARLPTGWKAKRLNQSSGITLRVQA